MLWGHSHGGLAGAWGAEPGTLLALVGTGWGRGLDEGLTPCARLPPPFRHHSRAGSDWQRETQPDKEAGPAWEPRAGAPTAHRPLPRAVLFVLPAAQSQPLHAHPVSRSHRLCPQTYLQFDHLAPPWLLPRLCPVLLQSLFCPHGVLGLTTQPLGQPHQTWPGGPEPSGNFPLTRV